MRPATPTPWTRQTPSEPRVGRRPQRGHGPGRIDHVLGLQQAADRGFADGDGTKHQGPVRHGLVAGNPDAAGEAGGPGGTERKGWL